MNLHDLLGFPGQSPDIEACSNIKTLKETDNSGSGPGIPMGFPGASGLPRDHESGKHSSSLDFC